MLFFTTFLPPLSGFWDAYFYEYFHASIGVKVASRRNLLIAIGSWRIPCPSAQFSPAKPQGDSKKCGKKTKISQVATNGPMMTAATVPSETCLADVRMDRHGTCSPPSGVGSFIWSKKERKGGRTKKAKSSIANEITMLLLKILDLRWPRPSTVFLRCCCCC